MPPLAKDGTTLTSRAPVGISTCGSSGRARMPHPANFGIHVTRFVPPQGAPPAAPVGAVACRPRPKIRHTPYADRAPKGAPLPVPVGASACGTPPNSAHHSRGSCGAPAAAPIEALARAKNTDGRSRQYLQRPYLQKAIFAEIGFSLGGGCSETEPVVITSFTVFCSAGNISAACSITWHHDSPNRRTHIYPFRLEAQGSGHSSLLAPLCAQLATDPLRQHGACDAVDRFRGSGVGGHGAVRSAAPRLRSKQHLARVCVRLQQFLLLLAGRGVQRLRQGLEQPHVCPRLPGGVLWPELRHWKSPPVLQHAI